MAREITMPETDAKEPNYAEMTREECAFEIGRQMDRYKRALGTTEPRGPGMHLLARAMVLLNDTKLRDAVHALYYAAHWTADRSVDGVGLWTAVRDAAGFEPGGSSSIPPSDYGVFLVHAKHAVIVASTIDYLEKTDPVQPTGE